MKKLYEGRLWWFSASNVPDKIYWFSRYDTSAVRWFWFPFAEHLARMKHGWKVIKVYITIRLWLEALWKK